MSVRRPRVPGILTNWIGGEERHALAGETFEKRSPANGERLARVARSRSGDVAAAVAAARKAQPAWAELTPVRRGDILHDLAMALREHRDEVIGVVASETGMSRAQAGGETDAAVALGLFMAGEGRRFYGRTTTSATPNKYAMTVRQPIGVAGLIVAANTPIANVAWKVFPALVCGNAAVLKAAEDAPGTAWKFGELARRAGIPPGVLNVVQGLGAEAGAPLVAHPEVDLISFTGSSAVGRTIASVAGERLARVSLELGGKNPLVVCDDADLENAARWVLASAFSNAGQRCAAGSRIIVFDAIYDRFRDALVERVRALRVGPGDDDDLGPVINERQLGRMLAAVARAAEKGARVLIGGNRLTDPDHAAGWYMAPTLIENVRPTDEISTEELFGPITCLYRVHDFAEALALADDNPYGLTACIHTRSVDRATQFTQKVKAGVAVVNGGTHGSEPHMPFGGFRRSGNGSREPGTEALDVYSELKDIYVNVDVGKL
jgi:aldehyde dehydrogenase (NAD+)